MSVIYLLLIEGYADWEASSAVAELLRTFGFAVKTGALRSEPVMSMGGHRISPHLTLSDFEPSSAAMLIIPRGDSWTSGELPTVSKALRAMAAKHPLAASAPRLSLWLISVCWTTISITSNGREFIGGLCRNIAGIGSIEPADGDGQVNHHG
jgi:hypothetical protein